ncbi:uncharacterized protein LOC115878577 isoform X2 [Sitophilus oryzae]|uniref:Uncharacterized protein LOC115878577 isoform X2 n=1 Tax=Sitophilus oryzae TaxID=7048 RepID=A0A6J2XI45_SITOR|nr:uncharacterized protein LOC115878577 isoform X2 [Sitophilus oryzae]
MVQGNERRCYVCNRKKTPELTFHKFPKNPSAREPWLKFCKLEIDIDYEYIKYIAICSCHFTPDDYLEPRAKELGNNLILKRGRYPTIKAPKPKKRLARQDASSIPENMQNSEPTVTKHISTQQSQVILVQQSNVSTSSQLPQLQPKPKLHRKMHHILPKSDHSPQLLIYNTVPVLQVGTIPTPQMPQKSPISTPTVPNECKIKIGATVVSSSEQPKILPFSTLKGPHDRLPRFVGDITSKHLNTLEDARWCFNLAKTKLSQQTKKIKMLHQSKLRLTKKVKNLEALVNVLMKNENPDNETIEVIHE